MRVVLVDDHAPIRLSLRRLLQLNPDITVVGEGTNGREAVVRVEELRPDVVLMDMKMPVMNGVEATRLIKDRYPEVQVLALTAFSDMTLVSGMVKAGASGYLLKGGSPDELFRSLQAVVKGNGALDDGVARGVLDDMAELYRKEQERANALADLDRMKSEFIASVSHELRTPLTSIKGGVLTLQGRWEQLDEATKHEFLDSMSRHCDRLTRIVGQILTVSGIQRGSLGLQPKEFSVADTVHLALGALAAKTAGRDVSLQSAPLRAIGDEARIAEVVLALIENALDFTSGGVTITVSEHAEAPIVEVADEGPGLAPGQVERLLNEPFGQGDGSSTRSVGGLGLSLYIARQVLEASGGRLKVRTSPETGSTFTMVLRPAA